MIRSGKFSENQKVKIKRKSKVNQISMTFLKLWFLMLKHPYYEYHYSLSFLCTIFKPNAFKTNVLIELLKHNSFVMEQFIHLKQNTVNKNNQKSQQYK